MKTKPKRILAGIGIALMAIFASGLLVRAIFNYAAGKKLEKHFEQAKAKGVPITLEDLGPACDEADNAAPFWKAAKALIFLKDEDIILLGQTINAFFSHSSLDEGSRMKLNRLIEKNRKALDLVLEASGKPCFRLAARRDPNYVELVDPVKMITAIRMLGIDAVFRADMGKTEAALEQCRSGMLFAQRLLDQPSLFSYMASAANMKCLVICLNRIASGRNIDPELMFRMMKNLSPQLWREEYARTCQGERILEREDFFDVIKGKTEVLTPGFPYKIFLWLTRPWAKSEILKIHSYFLDLEQQAHLPYYQTKEFQQKLRQKENSSSLFEKLSGMNLPSFSSVLVKEANLESFIITARIGLACKIFKQQRGRFPENIAALVPGILTEEPLDPFTGKPFIYRLQDGGFIVYGLGSNERDDGGRGTFVPSQLIMEKDDDIAWHEAREIKKAHFSWARPRKMSLGFDHRAFLPPAQEAHRQPDLQWETLGTIYLFMATPFKVNS